MNARVVALAASLAVPSLSAAETRLLWVNGDSLPGSVVSLEGDALGWDSPLFDAPLSVDVASLASVTFPATEQLVEIDEPLRADTASGDVLFGELVSIDKNAVVLESARHGRVSVKRGELVSLRRLGDVATLAFGGLAGWRALSPDRKLSSWRAESRGRVATSFRNSELYRTLDLPELAEVELALSWDGRPGFVFSVTREGDPRHPDSVGLETWDDELVVLKGADFEPVTRVSAGKNSVHLRIYLDRGKGQVTVCSHEGRQLAKISGESLGPAGKRGLFLRSKRGGLTLETLRIGRWDGRLPNPLKAGGNRLHLADGKVLDGSVTAYDAAAQTISVRGATGVESVPIGQLDVLYFEAKARPPAGGNIEISYHDGALVRGKLQALVGGEAQLRSAFSTEPITCSLTACRELAWPNAKQKPPQGGDVLFWEGGRSHGAIAGAGGEAFPIAWKPIGAKAPVPLLSTEPLRVLRQDIKPGKPGGGAFPDSIHLTDLTALPCRLQRVAEGVAVVTTPFNKEPVEVDESLLKVIEFKEQGGIEGFGDERWRRSGVDGEVKLAGGKAEFTKGGTLGHPTAMGTSALRFNVQWEQRSRAQLELRLFADSVDEGGGDAVRVPINLSYNSLSVTPPGGNAIRASRVSSSKADFAITCMRDLLVIRVNGEEVVREELDGGRPGRGVQFAVNSLSGLGGKGGGTLRISGFSTRADDDTPLYIRESVREKIFTVPRLRKSNPPGNAVVALNGDVLRGDLLSADREAVNFRSKLRELPIPRDRVAGIIWFHDERGEASRSGVARLLLEGGRMIALDPESVDGGNLAGRSSVFGEIRVPLGKIREIHLGSYTPPERVSPYADWKLRPAKEPEPVSAAP